MPITKEVPEFEGMVAWFWWRDNKGSGIISEWVAMLINAKGYVVYPRNPTGVPRATALGGEWWDAPIVTPPKSLEEIN